MGTWVGPRSPRVFESRAGVLREIDHALALFGSAHWIESVPALTHEIGGQSTSIKWHLWCTKKGFCRQSQTPARCGRWATD